MPPTFKELTRKSIRDYVHESIVNRMNAKGMTIDVLASWSGMNTNRTADIVLEAANPTFDEVAMMFTALNIPLDHLTAHVKALPYFQRQDNVVELV